VAKAQERPLVNTQLSEDIRSRLLVARLPSPPQTLLKLLTLCQSEDAGIAELAALIGYLRNAASVARQSLP